MYDEQILNDAELDSIKLARELRPVDNVRRDLRHAGHCDDGGGVQKHSAGPHYPWVIVQVGHDHDDCKVYAEHPDGRKTLPAVVRDKVDGVDLGYWEAHRRTFERIALGILDDN